MLDQGICWKLFNKNAHFDWLTIRQGTRFKIRQKQLYNLECKSYKLQSTFLLSFVVLQTLTRFVVDAIVLSIFSSKKEDFTFNF